MPFNRVIERHISERLNDDNRRCPVVSVRNSTRFSDEILEETLYQEVETAYPGWVEELQKLDTNIQAKVK